MENKKKYEIIAVVCLLLLIVMGSTYAYWTTTKIQEDENIIGTTCLNLTLTNETDGIELLNTYPIIDSEGMATPGYTFTITNNCTGYIAYAVNLESLSVITSSNRIDSQYINAVLDNNAVQTLSSYPNGVQVLPTSDAYEAKTLTTGILSPSGQSGASKTYTLRIWLDKDAPTTQMNKSWEGKITINGNNTEAPVDNRAITYLSNLAATDDSIIDDGTTDHNLRFIGSNPNNYVTFNNELWRIIGVMNNVKGSSTDTGTGETRIKLIKATPLNDTMAWSSTETTGYYINNWEYATLNDYLNDTYFNNLSDNDLVDTATYYLGGYDERWDYQDNNPYNMATMTPDGWYTAERTSTNVFDNNPSSVTNYIALMYPSDIGYATNGGATAAATTQLDENSTYNETKRNNCMSKAVYYWGNRSSWKYCVFSDWLFDTSVEQFTLSPVNPGIYYAAATTTSASFISTSVSSSKYVRPVLYLKSDAELIADSTHTGASNHPYGLQI